jgi:stress response protein YsnF
MKSTRKMIPVTLVLSALSVAALTSGCAHSHPKYYTTTTAPETTTTTTVQTSQPYSGSSGSATEAQASPSQTQTAAATSESGSTVVPLYQESIKVGTREVEGGSVRLKKVVTTETVNQPVQIRRERLVIDRDTGGAGSQQGSQQASSFSGQPFQEQEVVIKLKREEPVVETQMIQSGRIVAQKQTETQQQSVQRQVRHEDVQVEKIGNPENVIISQNLRSGEASGAGPALEGKAQGQSQGGNAPITDVMILTSTQDAASLNGRPVNISTVKVQQIVGEHVVVLQSGNEKVLVRSATPVTVREGDTVMIRGVVRQVPAETTALQLSEQEGQALKAHPVYIDARSIQSASGSQSNPSTQ